MRSRFIPSSFVKSVLRPASFSGQSLYNGCKEEIRADVWTITRRTWSCNPVVGTDRNLRVALEQLPQLFLGVPLSEAGGNLVYRANRQVRGKRIIKGRPIGVGFDRSHHHLQQGAPS
jgi:hypothetical protein